MQKEAVRLIKIRKISASLFYELQQALQQQQVLFEHTGGLHAAALFDFAGHCRLLSEDIGCHNAPDKVIGRAFLNDQLPLHQSILAERSNSPVSKSVVVRMRKG